MKALKILAVNDSKSIIALFRVMSKARKLPITLDEAYNGEEAVEKIRKGNTYDAILTGISLPLRCGITITEEIRALGYTNPIIAWTFLMCDRSWKICKEAGMNGYIYSDRGDSIDNFLEELKKANIIDTWERREKKPRAKEKSMLQLILDYEKRLDSR